MNLWPIITREFRIAARRKETYQLRTAPAWWLVIGAGFFLHFNQDDPAEQGHLLFIIFHAVTFGLIWLFVPIALADVISQERREGTLGLLVLTSLRGSEIAAAKCLSQFLQVLAPVVATVPLFALPLLIGGVTGADIMRAACLNLTAVVGACSAGLLASVWCIKAWRAGLLALPVSALLWLLVHFVHAVLMVGHAYWKQGLHSSPGEALRQLANFFEHSPEVVFMLPTGAGELLWRQPEFASSSGTVLIAGATLAFALLLGWLVVVIAGWRIGCLHQRSPRPVFGALQSLFTCERFLTRRLVSGMRRLLEVNPIAWFHQRRWGARFSRLIWLLVVTAILGLFSQGRFAGENLTTASLWALMFVLVGLWFSSATALREERDQGELELLLSTKLTPASLIDGRLQAMWRSCVPAVHMLLLLACGSLPLALEVFTEPGKLLLLLTWLVVLPVMVAICVRVLPVIGLFFSLICRDGGSAVILSLVFAVVMPWGIPLLIFMGGMLSHQLLHRPPPGGELEVWMTIGIWITGTAAVQLALVVARRRGVLPRLWPAWWSRWRLTLALPWAGPMLFWLVLESGLHGWLEFNSHAGTFLVAGWQGCALLLLLQYGRHSRRELECRLSRLQLEPALNL